MSWDSNEFTDYVQANRGTYNPVFYAGYSYDGEEKEENKVYASDTAKEYVNNYEGEIPYKTVEDVLKDYEEAGHSVNGISIAEASEIYAANSDGKMLGCFGDKFEDNIWYGDGTNSEYTAVQSNPDLDKNATLIDVVGENKKPYDKPIEDLPTGEPTGKTVPTNKGAEPADKTPTEKGQGGDVSITSDKTGEKYGSAGKIGRSVDEGYKNREPSESWAVRGASVDKGSGQGNDGQGQG